MVVLWWFTMVQSKTSPFLRKEEVEYFCVKLYWQSNKPDLFFRTPLICCLPTNLAPKRLPLLCHLCPNREHQPAPLLNPQIHPLNWRSMNGAMSYWRFISISRSKRLSDHGACRCCLCCCSWTFPWRESRTEVWHGNCRTGKSHLHLVAQHEIGCLLRHFFDRLVWKHFVLIYSSTIHGNHTFSRMNTQTKQHNTNDVVAWYTCFCWRSTL